MPKNILAILKGFFVSVILLIVLIFLGTLALAFTPLEEQQLAIGMSIGRFLCVFAGAAVAAHANGRMGLWQGLGVSGMFIVFFILCRLFLALGLNNMVFISAMFLLAGALGGLAGILLVK